MSAPETVLFDLDGTLTDPFIGITRSMRHAIEHVGYQAPAAEDLARWIGPPLRLTFRAVLESEEEELIERAVAAYRQRYFDVGYLENTLYPGVADLLSTLRRRDLRLYIVTSKVEPLARMIMEHFALDGEFAGIHGTEMGGRLDDKSDLMREMMAGEGIDNESAVMIGDTRFDMIAARTCGVRSIGVTYGYGSPEELLTHGAAALCDTPMEIGQRLEEMTA